MEIDVIQDCDATAAVEFVTLVDESAEAGANHNAHNLIGQGRKQHHALRQQAKRRRKNTTIAASGGGGAGTIGSSHSTSIPRIIVKPLPPQPTQGPGLTDQRNFTAVQPMEEITVNTAATVLPLRTMPTMREVLASIPGFSIKAPKKRNNKKLSAAVQLEQTKAGCIDLETPDSILVNTNLRSLLNKYTFSLLPSLYQHKLVQLLPNVDRQVITNTNDSLRLQPSSLNNEFFARACLEWQERLAEGEFTPEHQQKLRSEADRERSKLDPWKLKHFEPIWGDRSRYLHYDLSNDPSLLLQQQQSSRSTLTPQQQEGCTANSNLRPPIKTTIKLRPSASSSHNSFTQVRSTSLRNRHCNSSCYSASNYSIGSTSTASSNSLNSSPVKRLRTVGAMTRSCTSSYYTRTDLLTSSLSSTDKATDMPPIVTTNTNVRGCIPDLLPIRGTRSTTSAIAVTTATSASVLKATEVMIPQIQHGAACTKEVDPLLLPDSLQQAVTQQPSSSSSSSPVVQQHLPRSPTSTSTSTRAHHLAASNTNTHQPSIAGIHLPEISIINITETILPQNAGSSGSRTVMDIRSNLRTSITITQTGGMSGSVVTDKKRRRSRSRNNMDLVEGMKQQRRNTNSSNTASSMSATDVAAVFANKRNDLEIFVIEPEIMSTGSRSIESTTTNTATSMDDPSNDSNDLDGDDDDDINDIQEIQVVDEDIIMLMEEDEEIEEIEDEELALEEVNVVENHSLNRQYHTATDHVVDVPENSSLELDDEIDDVDGDEDEEVEDEFEVLEEDILKENIGVNEDIVRDLDDNSRINNLDQDFHTACTGVQVESGPEYQLQDLECVAENKNKANEERMAIDDISQEDERNCSENGNIIGEDVQHTFDIIVKEDLLDSDKDLENDNKLEGMEIHSVSVTDKMNTAQEIQSSAHIPTNFELEKTLQSPRTDLSSNSSSKPHKPTQQEDIDTNISTKQGRDDSSRTSPMIVIVDSSGISSRQLNVLDCQIDTLDSTQNDLQSLEKIEELTSPSQSTNNSDSNSQTGFFKRSDFNSSLIEFNSDNANADSLNEVVVQEEQTSLQQVAGESFSNISVSSFCDPQQPSSVNHMIQQQEQQEQVQMLNDDASLCDSVHQSGGLELVDAYMLPSALLLQHQQANVVEKSDCMEDMFVAQVVDGGDSNGCVGYDDDEDDDEYDEDVADGEEECDDKLDSITSSLVNSTNFPCTSRHSTTGGISSFSSHNQYEDEEANEDRFLDAETYVLESGQISLDDDDVGGVCSADTTSSSAASTKITLVIQPQQQSSAVVEQLDEIVVQHDGMVGGVPGCSKEVDGGTNDGTDNTVPGVQDTVFGTVSTDLLQAPRHQHDCQEQQTSSTSAGHLDHAAADQEQDEGHGETNNDCCWDDVVDSSTEKLMHSMDSVRVDTSTGADVVLNCNNSNSSGSICDVESPSSESDVGGVMVLQHQLATVDQQLLVQEVDGEQQLVVGVVGMRDQHLGEDVVRLEEFPVVSVNADWLAAQYEMKVNSNNSLSVSSVASVNSVTSLASGGTTCSISMVPTLTSTHTSDSSGSGSGSGSNSNSNNSSDMDNATMELPPLHALNNVNPPQLVIVGTTDNLHQQLNQQHQLENSTRQVVSTSSSVTMTGQQHNAPSISIGGSIATNGNVVSTSFPPTVHFTEYMAGNQLKLELEVTLTPEIVNSENMVSSTVGTLPSISNSPSSISTPTSINTTAMPRLTVPSRSITKAVSTGILPKTTIVCLPHQPSTSAAQYQHEPCHSVETIQHAQQIPASFLHQQQLLLQQQQQQQQATNAVYSVPQMVRAVAATSAAGNAGLNAQMPGSNSNAQLPYITLVNNNTSGQPTRIRTDGSTTTSCHKSKKKASSSSSRSSNSRSNSQRDNKPPPPGAVNLERSYQICQAVIQNSPNRDQLRGQLKPPPSALLATATVNTAKAKAAAAATTGTLAPSVTAVVGSSSSNGSGKSGTVQYAGITTSSNKEGNVSGTFTPPLLMGTTSAGNGGATIASSSTSRLHQGYEVASGGSNGVKVKTRATPYAQHRQSSPPVLLRHVFTNNQAMPVTLAVLPQGQPINPEQHHPHATVTASSSLGSTPPPSHVQTHQQQQYIIVQPQPQPHQRSIGRYHGHQHHLHHVRSSSTNGVPTASEHSSPTALVARSSSAPPNSHHHLAPSNLLMTTTARAPYSASASSTFSSSFTSGSSLCTSTTTQVATQPHRQQHLPYIPPLAIANNNTNHHQHTYIDNIVNVVDSHTIPNTTAPTTMVVLVSNHDQQMQQSNTMSVVQCGPSAGTQAVTRRPRVTSRLLTPQESLLADVGADISSGATQARLQTTYTLIGGDMEQHPGVAMIQSRANNASHLQQPRPSSGALASGSVPASPSAARRAPVSDSNCPCSLKALAICKKCGAFCHDECISANKLCRTCYIR